MMRRLFTLGMCVALGLVVSGSAQAQTAAHPNFDALVKAAQAEKEVTLYGAVTENVLARLAKEFTAKYGIKVQFLRLSGAPLLQRYATEAESGNIGADVMLSSSDMLIFADTAVPKGWMQSLADANLPAMAQFPKEFDYGKGAIAQIQLWQLGYNTEKLKGPEIPKDWDDMINPRFKDAFMLPDPASAVPYMEFWWMLHQKYGDAFFDKLRALNPRRFPSGVPAAQSLAAGEGSIQAPVTGPQIQALQEKGAPVGIVKPSFTTGVEMYVMLSDAKKSKSPNAGRLLANYMLSPEGNAVLNADPGNVSVYDKSAMPAQYVPPDRNAPSKKDQLRKLLGF